MKNKNTLLLIISAILIVSCNSVSHKDLNEKAVDCSEEKMIGFYFSDWEKAVNCADLNLKTSNNNRMLQKSCFILGEYYFMKGDPSRAFEHFIRSIKGGEGNLALASLYYIRNINFSFDQIEKLMKLDTSLIKDPFARSLVENEKNEWILVSGDFEKSEKISSDLNGYFEKKEPDSAFEKYIFLIAKKTAGEKITGQDYYKFYSTVIGSKNPPVLYLGAGVLNSEKEYAKGESLLKSIINSNPYLVKPVVEILNIMNDSDRSDEQLEIISELPLFFENNIDYRLFLSDFYSLNGQLILGLKNSEATVEKFGDFFSSHFYYSLALEEFGDIQTAMKIRLKLLRRIPYYYPLLHSIEILADKTKNSNIQRNVLLKMTKIYPDDQKIKYRLGENYLTSRQIKKAEKLFKEILEKQPENIEALIGIGDVETFKNNQVIASHYYRKAMLLDPENDAIYDKISILENKESALFFKKFSLSEDALEEILKTPSLMTLNPYEIIYDEGIQRVVNQKLVKSIYRIVIKVNDQEGVSRLSQFPFAGNIISIRLIKKDGSVSNDFVVDGNKIFFNSLQPYDVIDVKYGQTEKAEHLLQGFNSVWLFGEFGVLNRKSQLIVYIPENIPVNFSINGKVNRFDFSYENGTVYSFKTENTFIPLFEPLMTSDRQQFIPNVEYSLIASWDDFANWQIRFIKESLVLNDQMFSISEKIGRSDLLKEQIIEILRDFVARKISYSFDDSGVFAVKPESTESTLKKMSGDSKDKALLLKMLLNYAGIKAQYSLVKSNNSGAFKKEIPFMQFDHALVYIQEQSGISEGFFLDPVSDYDYYCGINSSIENTEAIVFDEIDEKFFFKTVKSKVNSSLDVVFNPVGASTVTYTGVSASDVRLKYNSGEKLEKIVEDSVFKFSRQNIVAKEAKLEGSIFSEPLIIRFDNQKIIPNPAKAIFGDLSNETSRNYPIEFSSFPETISFTVLSNVNIPDKYFEIDTPFFHYKSDKYESSGIKIGLKFKMNRIAAEEFAELKKTIISVIEFENKLSVE